MKLKALVVIFPLCAWAADSPPSPFVPLPTPTLYGYMTYGQSLSVCISGAGPSYEPSLESSQPAGYNNFALADRTPGGTQTQGGPNLVVPFLVQPLGLATGWATGYADASAECPEWAAAAQLTKMAGGGTNLQSVWAMNGDGGQVYDALKRVPSAPAAISQITNPVTHGYQYYSVLYLNKGKMETAATNQSPGYNVQWKGETFTHGESDNGSTITNTYVADVAQHQIDLSYDFGTPMRLFVDQLGNTLFGSNNPSASTSMAWAQWIAARDYPGKIIMTMPKWPTTYLPYSTLGGGDGVHLSNVAYRYLGAQQAKVIYRNQFLGIEVPHLSMMVKSFSRSGNTVSFSAWVPYPPCVSDNVGFPTQHNNGRTWNDWGFYYLTYQGSTLTEIPFTIDPITGPVWTTDPGGDSCSTTLTLSSPVPGGTTKEQLAYGYKSSGTNIPSNVNRVGGNIRDSDPETDAYSGGHLYNWLVGFRADAPFSWNPVVNSMTETPSTVTLNYTLTGNTPSQVIALATDQGSGLDNWSATLSASPKVSMSALSGSSNGNVTVTLIPAGLTAGNYSDSVTMYSYTGTVKNSPHTLPIAVTVFSPPTITTDSTLPNATRNAVYSTTLSGSGGQTPYTWTLISGTLPIGLSLDSSTGIISGIPTVNGTSTFTIQLTDAGGASTSQPFQMSVASHTITSTSPLPGGVKGLVYSFTFTGSGGSLPYTWSIISGSVPGLSMDSSTGVYSGTPTASGTYNITVNLREGGGANTFSGFTLDILPPKGSSTNGIVNGIVH